MKTVIQPSANGNTVYLNDTDISTSGSLYGVEHKKFADNGKRFKVHVRPTDGAVELIGFRNSTGHLNEEKAFGTLSDVFNYCQTKGHALYEFTDRDDFAEWLLS